MTKRFSLKLGRFYDNDVDGCFLDTLLGDEDVLHLLNKLNDENDQLKQQNDKLIRLIDDLGHDEMNRQMMEILK